MNLQEIARTRLISKDGHFIPLVFVDMSLPAAYAAAAATYAGKQINHNLNDKTFSPIPIYVSRLQNVVVPQEVLNVLSDSINDIDY